ncbi:hypothetical protein J6590_032306 [Homalodisca vitripennis]|nr:hypothetical protein J6590_032306 [Homalodisca vitripennis]
MAPPRALPWRVEARERLSSSAGSFLPGCKLERTRQQVHVSRAEQANAPDSTRTVFLVAMVIFVTLFHQEKGPFRRTWHGATHTSRHIVDAINKQQGKPFMCAKPFRGKCFISPLYLQKGATVLTLWLKGLTVIYHNYVSRTLMCGCGGSRREHDVMCFAERSELMYCYLLFFSSPPHHLMGFHPWKKNIVT